jgi:hypothetical protein
MILKDNGHIKNMNEKNGKSGPTSRTPSKEQTEDIFIKRSSDPLLLNNFSGNRA